VMEDGSASRSAAQNAEYNSAVVPPFERRALIVGKVDRKKESCDGEVGLDVGKAPIFTSFVNK
jgi:hypothetical protein